jgi:hypothetical protein
MVLSSGRAAQNMEAGSSSFPGVGASGLNLRKLEGMVAPKNSKPPALRSFDEINVFILAQIHAYRIVARSATVAESVLPGARLEIIVFDSVPPDGVASSSLSATERELLTTTTNDCVTFFRRLRGPPWC